MVKGNSIIPVGPVEGALDGDGLRDLVLRVYDLADRCSLVLPDGGRPVEVAGERTGEGLRFRLSRPVPGIRVTFMGMRDLAAVSGEAERGEPCDGAATVLVRGASFAARV
jgi:hypothetical protein